MSTSPFFPGEEERVIEAVAETITKTPITVGELLEIITTAGKLTGYGAKPGLVLSSRLRELKTNWATKK